ncbi:metal tolerance protein 9-like [Arabidopsis lyrata subsp. lyrata]|uniref:metal tolerance protein 9-like n=1 Tax=Arabidopsis lyrata subsp. lyrata TaxID=81972 RepID=UPI000A29BDE2|nr:metal tolerance protein 9-like [Arabidopsis lyrata subsp. lyrata]|eukprot:XP_020891197.1 metal tolerance protein 9-like [Arabidopsis lyrata subsp. lyrata]
MAATEHHGLSGGDYNVDLLPIDEDDSPPSSWRLSLDTFRLPSSSPLSSGRHNGRTRLSRYLRTPKKERKVSEYYKQQEKLLEGFNEMESINETGFVSGAPTEVPLLLS